MFRIVEVIYIQTKQTKKKSKKERTGNKDKQTERERDRKGNKETEGETDRKSEKRKGKKD